MEIGSPRTHRSVSFGFVVLGLVTISAGLIAMLAIATQGAAKIPDPATRRLLLRLAWLSLALLCLAVVLLIWAILRQIRYNLRMSPPLKPSQYVNAWELAGKRFQLEEDDADEAGAEDEGEDDEPGR